MKISILLPKCIIKKYTIVICMFLPLLYIGCAKKESENINGQTAILRFKVDGVNEINILPNLSASVGNMVGLAHDESPIETIYQENIALDVHSVQKNMSPLLSKEGPINKTKLGATIPLESGIRYKLLIYTLTDELVASTEAEVGKEQHISVASGRAYKWRAYSYNSKTQMPIFNPTNPTIETPTTTTLLYDKSDNTGVISSNGTVLPIVFKHQLTQINVQIGMKTYDNVRTVKSLTAEFIGDVIKKRSFNVFTGNMEGNLQAVNVGPLTFNPLIQGSNKTLIAKGYYTADQSYITYSVKINSLSIQETKQQEKNLTSVLPTPSGGVKGQINFTGFTGNNKGTILLGRMEIGVIMPKMTIVAFSNSAHSGGYRLAPGTASNMFLTDLRNFGPSSTYVRTDGIRIESSNVSLGDVAARLATPANYPDILYLACDGDYLNAGDWAAVKLYLAAGGTVYHGQDNTGSVASTFIRDIFGLSTGTLQRPGQSYTTYKFTDTQEGLNDTLVLKGPFGDVTNLYWGQDRVGTVYFTNYSNEFLDNAIIYSNHSQNTNPLPAASRACYFRHKTLNYFFIGDGGFTLYDTPANHTQYPFRINNDNFPIVQGYGNAPTSLSPAYGIYSGTAAFPIANSLMFGNLVNQFLNKVHFNGITGQVRTP